jgi:hypothetical protein
MHACMYALYDRTRPAASSIHMYLPIDLLLLPHPHNMHPHIHTLYLSSPPALLLRHVITEPCNLRLPNLPCSISILISITIATENCVRHSRSHTYTSPPPGDLTLPYLPLYITFRAYCIFSLPRYPPLFLPTPSSRSPMAAIIACYIVYAHYHQRVGMYVCEPARVGACMYAERGFCSLLFFRIALFGPIDCGPAVRGRIGWISCQVTF